MKTFRELKKMRPESMNESHFCYIKVPRSRRDNYFFISIEQRSLLSRNKHGCLRDLSNLFPNHDRNRSMQEKASHARKTWNIPLLRTIFSLSHAFLYICLVQCIRRRSNLHKERFGLDLNYRISNLSAWDVYLMRHLCLPGDPGLY